MNGYDGPTLRSLRESRHLALRKVARVAGISHGHLSKVERGEPGRPVTHAILNAYEKVCGIKLTSPAGHHPDDNSWRRGYMSAAHRRTLNAKVAAVAVGGVLGETIDRTLDATGRILAPDRLDTTDIAAVEQATSMLTTLDLSTGGGTCDQLARAILRWAAGLLKTDTTDTVETKLYAAIGALAERAGWAVFDTDSHDVARRLFTIGLYTAARANDPDLRAHLLADIAAQHSYLGYPEDALHVARLAEADERVTPPVRMVLNGVKARAFGMLGDTDACRHHLIQAEKLQARAAGRATTGWQATIATPEQLAAATGHALVSLARRTDSAQARTDAQQHLADAADQLGPHRRRAAALCRVQLATLHLETGQLDDGLHHARHALDTATGIRSARLAGHLAALRTTAAAHSNEPDLAALIADIDTVTAPAAVPETNQTSTPQSA